MNSFCMNWGDYSISPKRFGVFIVGFFLHMFTGSCTAVFISAISLGFELLSSAVQGHLLQPVLFTEGRNHNGLRQSWKKHPRVFSPAIHACDETMAYNKVHKQGKLPPDLQNHIRFVSQLFFQQIVWSLTHWAAQKLLSLFWMNQKLLCSVSHFPLKFISLFLIFFTGSDTCHVLKSRTFWLSLSKFYNFKSSEDSGVF